MKLFSFVLLVLCSVHSSAQVPNEPQGITELKLNGGCWPLGVNGRWPSDVTEQEMARLAMQGNANAQFLTAIRLLRVHTVIVSPGTPVGVGVNASSVPGQSPVFETVADDPQGVAAGLRLLTQAARQGHIRACMKLGDIYKEGKIVPANIKEAVKWWTKAADHDSEEAMCSLGDAYRDAFIFVDAYKWYALASAQCSARGGDMRYYYEQRDYLGRGMEPHEVGEAQKLIEEWKRAKAK